MQARSVLRIKELQDQVQRLNNDVYSLGLELDGKEDAVEQQINQYKVRRLQL
jgi:hypothetical protein